LLKIYFWYILTVCWKLSLQQCIESMLSKYITIVFWTKYS